MQIITPCPNLGHGEVRERTLLSSQLQHSTDMVMEAKQTPQKGFLTRVSTTREGGANIRRKCSVYTSLTGTLQMGQSVTL